MIVNNYLNKWWVLTNLRDLQSNKFYKVHGLKGMQIVVWFSITETIIQLKQALWITKVSV